MQLNTTGSSNTAVGGNALDANTTGASNVSVGAFSLTASTTASNNVAVGQSSLFCNTTGTLNVAIGVDALRENVEGDQSVAIGHEALRNQNPVGNADMNNVAVGLSGCAVYDDGVQNTAVGSLRAAVEHHGLLTAQQVLPHCATTPLFSSNTARAITRFVPILLATATRRRARHSAATPPVSKHRHGPRCPLRQRRRRPICSRRPRSPPQPKPRRQRRHEQRGCGLSGCVVYDDGDENTAVGAVRCG
jgi:hypothetical protein